MSVVGEQRWPAERLVGERVVLERHRLDAAARMFELVDRDRARLGRFLPWVEHTLTVADEVDYIRHTHEAWEEATLFDFSILRRGDDVYCGNVGVHHLRWAHGGAEIGYWIGGEHEGRGLVTDAVRTAQTALFGLGIQRIEIRCDSLNVRSQSIPRRLGYTLEGTLRRHQRVGAGFRDILVFSRLSTDGS